MLRRPVEPHPENTTRPPPASALKIASAKAWKGGDANTRRAIGTMSRSTESSCRTPAAVEAAKVRSMSRVFGFDCSVGRNPRWNCRSFSMKSFARASIPSM